MVRFNSKFKSRKKIKLVNEEFLPSREEFNSNKIEIDLKKGIDKEVVFYSEEVIFSKTNNKLKFTNYIADVKQQNKINAMHNFAKNYSLIKENTDDATNLEYNDRMISILSLYLKEKTESISSVLVKSDIREGLGIQEGLRVYWYYDLTDEKIKIVCIDPQHLVLPSRHKGKNKDEMMTVTFNQTINSKNHCISKYFEISN